MKNEYLQVKPIKTKEGEKAEILISNDFSIHNIEEMKAEFDTIADNFQLYEIVIEKPESFDLAAMQLLISFRNSIENKGRKVNIKISLTEGIDQIITHSGIKKHLIN